MVNKSFRSLRNQHDDNFWPTFTDLLTGILLVILLIFLFYVMLENERLAALEEEIIDKQLLIEEQEEQIERITGLRTDIITGLQLEFESSDIPMEIDPNTGAIIFDSELLFDYGESALKQASKEQLQNIIPRYISVLYDDQFREQIAEIIVEGHTDDEGSFMYNLTLSQERAFSVVQYLLGEEIGTYEHKEQLKTDITANGRSWSNLVYDSDSGEVDPDKSRRVEIKFRIAYELDFDSLEHKLQSSD
ncbi:MAG: OmpA family protein [Bacillaceae bacterium]|nr:OmpA family protein [Bacillaceae bacterium]